jgi:TPR repeat protein
VSIATQFLGRGAPKDYTKAARWYREAANGGDVGAQYILASMYEKGDGVAKDLRLALYWYTRTAQQGDAVALAKARAVARQFGAEQR